MSGLLRLAAHLPSREARRGPLRGLPHTRAAPPKVGAVWVVRLSVPEVGQPAPQAS